MPQSKKAPAYQWFVKDWRSSRATMRMSMAERGVYREMLDEQWEERSLPDSAEEVADIIATTETQRAEVLAAWPVVRRKFVVGNGASGRIYNVRLERARREYKEFQRAKQIAGQTSAARAVRREDGTFQPHSNSTPTDAPTDTQQNTNSAPTGPPTGIQPSSASASASARDTRARGGDEGATDASDAERVVDAFRGRWTAAYGFACSVQLKPLEYMQLDRQLTAHGSARLLAAIGAYFVTDDPYVRKARHPLALFLRDPLKYLAGDAVVASRPRGCRHEPACVDDAAHTSRDMADRRIS